MAEQGLCPLLHQLPHLEPPLLGASNKARHRSGKGLFQTVLTGLAAGQKPFPQSPHPSPQAELARLRTGKRHKCQLQNTLPSSEGDGRKPGAGTNAGQGSSSAQLELGSPATATPQGCREGKEPSQRGAGSWRGSCLHSACPGAPWQIKAAGKRQKGNQG